MSVRGRREFFDVRAVEIDPQGGTGHERLPPSLAYVVQCDHVLIPRMALPELRNEREDFGRDPVDWQDPVPPGSNRLEDLENFLLKSGELT